MNATEMTAAMKLHERDLRARMLADSCVAVAMQELRNEESEEPYGPAREYAYRVANLATAMLVSRIYNGDEEIRALREERDRLKAMVEDYVRITPFTLNSKILTQP